MKLLVIEDNAAMQTTLQRSFERRGFRVGICDDGAKALNRWRAALPDVVLLDLSMPGQDGLDVLAQARAEGLTTPVIIITARTALEDRLAGLDSGADDVVLKPFDIPELVSRLHAVVRRSARQSHETWQFGDLTIAPRARTAHLAGQPLPLTAREFQLLTELAREPGAVVAKSRIAQRLSPLDEPVDAAVRIAERYGAAVSLSGCIASPDGRRWQVPTGHPGLGTGGSGDVLAGAIAGLLARGADAEQASCWGTYLHATAGDRLAARVGRLGFLAGELADELPVVLVETDA